MSENFDNMKVLRKQGLSLEEIAEEISLNESTIQIYLRVINRGFKSLTEYHEHLVKQRGFESLTEYQEHLAKQRGFESLTKYRKHLVKQRGFESLTEYHEHLVKQRGFESLTKYYEYLAKERGFESLTEYHLQRYRKRQERPLNKKLSKLIKQHLEILNKNARWLADELGITEGAISRYKDGKTTPRRSLQPKLFKILELPYKTIDNIIKNET